MRLGVRWHALLSYAPCLAAMWRQSGRAFMWPHDIQRRAGRRLLLRLAACCEHG